MTKNEIWIERINDEAMAQGKSYGQYVPVLEKNKTKKPKKEKPKKTEPVRVAKTEKTEPVEYEGRLKKGWSLKMVEDWHEVRRLFGKE